MLAGGPGRAQVSPQLFSLFQPELLGGILAARDIVLIEQRGTEHSEPFLSCPEASGSSWAAYQQGLTGAGADSLTRAIITSYTDPGDPSLTIRGEITVDDMASVIYEQQGDHIGAMSLPALLVQIVAGGAATVVELLGPLKGAGLLAGRTPTPGAYALLMHIATVCSDDPVTSIDEVKLQGAGRHATLFGRAGAAE